MVMDCALTPGAAAQPRKGLGRQGHRPHRPDPRDLRPARPHARRARCRSSSRISSYQKGRLVRSWTHLERQRGGFGFLGGPGETQIEADRRMIQERMTPDRARSRDASCRRAPCTATSRRRVPYPIVALVGYTNAGKSTLFNRLTAGRRAGREHAVRDPRPDLARDRAAAWREGDPVRHGRLHLRSADHAGRGLPRDARGRGRGRRPAARPRRLPWRDGGAGRRRRRASCASSASIRTTRDGIIEVWNKADLLSADERERLAATVAANRRGAARPVLISALTGEGIPEPPRHHRGAPGRRAV